KKAQNAREERSLLRSLDKARRGEPHPCTTSGCKKQARPSARSIIAPVLWIRTNCPSMRAVYCFFRFTIVTEYVGQLYTQKLQCGSRRIWSSPRMESVTQRSWKFS